MGEEHFEEFSTLISGIHGNIQKLKSRYAAQLGLKPVHIFWLYLLREHPEGMYASELAAACRSDRGLVSREVDALLKSGVIYTQETGERRRYGWRLLLTPKGEALASVISAVAKSVQDSISRDVTEADLQIFYRTLHTLSDGLDRLMENNNIQEMIDNERKIDERFRL